MARSGTQPGADAATLVDVLRRRVDEQAERLIYRFLSEDGSEAHRLTGSQLGSRVRALARRLAAVGEPGDRALLLYPAGLEFIVAFLGCLAASRVAVPAYPPRVNRGQPRLRAIAEDSRPRLVLTTAALLPQAGELAAQIPELAGAEWIATDGPLEDPGEWPGRLPGPADLAFLQYTSGSTAVPKGVRVLHGSLIHNEEMIRRSFGLSEESVVVGWLPLYHDMGLIGNVLQPLYAGARCVLMSPLTFLQRPARWLEAIARYGTEGPVTSGGPNFAYDLCARKVGADLREGLDLSAWTVAYNGAEPVRRETLDRFAGEFAACGFRPEAFFPCYGLAEATLFASGGGRGRGAVVTTVEAAGLERGVAVPSAGAGTRDLVSSGHAWMGQAIAVVDPESRVRCSDGEVGEIWLSGPSVADGYWNRPAETAETFGARPAGATPDEAPYLRTGDLGFLSGGELFVTGRRKELIVLRGRNHYPQDIERTAERAHPALRPGCGAAFAIEPEAGSGGTERLVVVYEAERARNVDLDAAADAVRRAVAEEHEVEVHEVVLV
ncbi:MAG TPA: fatty acyl-AMP ligase, partial [Thermoanaerobaculia bacterium]|nr:fatty acyl-AMP ligase [Thermoanaerobaculia bacterium]